MGLRKLSLFYKLFEKYLKLILLDAGDIIQGDSSIFYFSHVAPEIMRPLPVIEMMNWVKYDALNFRKTRFRTADKNFKTEYRTSVIHLAGREYQLS